MKDTLKEIHDELGINSRQISEYKLARCEEPTLSSLEVVGIDFEGKPFILASDASRAWRCMCEAASRESVIFEPYSGFRSYIYQKHLILRKVSRGLPLEQIITETAIPGFSEHHSGRAVDICTDGVYKLTEHFEDTSAFQWLVGNASKFGFTMSYPRNNGWNIVFEPWHWCFRG